MIRPAAKRQERRNRSQRCMRLSSNKKGAFMSYKKFVRGLVLVLATTPVFAQTTAAPPAGRLLASNCYQCHGTNGSGGVESIRGESVNEIYGELKEMQRKSTPKMMDMHARGYTDAEIKLLATYLATLR
jgi:cytochrome c553